MVDSGNKNSSADLFREAVFLFHRRNYSGAVPLLWAASEEGSAEAQNLLGLIYLNGMGIDQQPQRAAAFFAEAATNGLKEASYNLSNLLFNGLGIPRDEALAQSHLLDAARAGHRPALRALGYLYHLADNGDRDLAELSTYCFRLAAEAGDPLAKYAFATRLHRGEGTDAEPVLAAAWYGAAARDGIYLAAARLAEFDEKARSLAATLPAPELSTPIPVRDLAPFETVEPVVPVASRESGFLAEYPGVLNECLCDYIINTAANQLSPSGVVDPLTGKAFKSELRTSYSMSCQASRYDAVISRIISRIARIAGAAAENVEPMGVLRYGPGQEYRPHHDYYSDSQHPAQRVTTVFVYLNDVLEGGGTEFPRTGLRVEPEQGKAVKFFNCDAAGHPNPDTLHAGLPVVRGEKWLATFWFWDRPFIWFS